MTLAFSFLLALAFAWTGEPLWVSGLALFGGFGALEILFGGEP